MSNDDPTEKVDVEKPVPPTEPTITTILERINALEERLTARIDMAVNELRTEMQTGFRKVEHKIELHARNLSDLYADERELEGRVGKLEEKAS